MTALIDADVIVYRSIFPATTKVVWEPGDEEMEMNNWPAAKEIALDLVDQWTKAAKKKRALLVFSDRTKEMASFRHLIHPLYKKNRVGEKPPMHNDLHDWLSEQFKSTYIKDLEGDDTMGLMATNDPKYTMVSIDKDMLTVPARLVNPDWKDPTPRKIGLREADYNWMYQTICGDTVDNFKGAPGAGPKRAAEALSGPTNVGALFTAAEQVFWDQSTKKSAVKMVHRGDDLDDYGIPYVTHPLEEFLMNARCARILRTGDYRQDEHKVKLWHPQKTKETWINPYVEIPEPEEESDDEEGT